MPRPPKLPPNNLPRLRTIDGLKNIIGPRVKERREALGLTQDQVVARLDITTNHNWTPSRLDLAGIEAGRRAVGDVELIVLASALECSPHWLLYGQNEAPITLPFHYPAPKLGDAQDNEET